MYKSYFFVLRNVLFFVCFVCFQTHGIAQKKQNFSIEQVWGDYAFYPMFAPEIHQCANSEQYVFLYKNIIAQMSYTEKRIDTLAIFPDSLAVRKILLNADNSKILLATNLESTHRYTYNARYYEYDFALDSIRLFSPLQIRNPQYASQGGMVCYAYNNNLYVADSNRVHSQITHDGKLNTIIHGTPDWVYEEEFDMRTAFLWSPNSRHIVYLTFDESHVPLYQIPLYDSVYPTYTTYSYPKAGYPVSKLTAHIYDVNSRVSTPISIPYEYDYIPEFSWIDDDRIAFTLLDRLQQQIQIVVYTISMQRWEDIYSFSSSTYCDIPTFFTPIPQSNNFIVADDRDGYTNLHVFDYSHGYVRQLTKNCGEITAVYGYSEDSACVYFQATNQQPTDRYVFSVDTIGHITQLFSAPGTHDVEWNTNFSYGIHTHTDVHMSPHVSSVNSLGKVQFSWFANDWVSQIWDAYGFTSKEFFSIPTETDTLEAWVILPHNFKSRKKYPVILTVYGGPTMQKVRNDFSYDFYWHQFLAQQGYVVVSVDCRGVMGKGSAFRKQTYANLGELEIQDFAAAATYISNFSYVDKNRIAIEGWSYGGYMAALALGKVPNVFAAGVAIAPLVDWKQYDAIYTERYMQRPHENPEGYRASSVFTYIDSITSPLFIIHGMIDDNVHPQNSYELARVLMERDANVEMLFFPNDHHSMFHENSRVFMYRRIFEFYERVLK